MPLTSLKDNARYSKFIGYLEITIRKTEVLIWPLIFAFLNTSIVQKETWFYRTRKRVKKETDKNPEIFWTSIFSSIFEMVELEP